MEREELRDEIIQIAQRLANIKIPCALVGDIGVPVFESVNGLKRIIVLLNGEADDNKEPKEE